MSSRYVSVHDCMKRIDELEAQVNNLEEQLAVERAARDEPPEPIVLEPPSDPDEYQEFLTLLSGAGAIER